ncbi:hypothetical protein ACP4OV_016485 [Aristida adscensionis]
MSLIRRSLFSPSQTAATATSCLLHVTPLSTSSHARSGNPQPGGSSPPPDPSGRAVGSIGASTSGGSGLPASGKELERPGLPTYAVVDTLGVSKVVGSQAPLLLPVQTKDYFSAFMLCWINTRCFYQFCLFLAENPVQEGEGIMESYDLHHQTVWLLLMDLILPYRVGDLAEAKSFVEGYRGAWFRCKVKSMRVTPAGEFECYLEYIDYTEETNEWLVLFQMNPAYSEQASTQSSEIMIRPSFPLWYWADQVPEESPNQDVIAIVDGTWKVGDLVDWFSEGCYWSGKITKIPNADMVEVELLKPPMGEGKRYFADRNDLRPTLDWSLEKGWTVPLSKARRKTWCAARLIRHESESDDESADGGGSVNDGDSEDVEPAVSTASNMPQEASPTISSMSGVKDTIPTSMENVKAAMKSSKPPEPHHAAQGATSSHHPPAGARTSIKQEPGTEVPIRKEQDSFIHQLDDAVTRLDAVAVELEQLQQ